MCLKALGSLIHQERKLEYLFQKHCHLYVCLRVHTHTHTRTHMCIYTHIHTCLCMYIYTHMHTHVSIYVCTQTLPICAQACPTLCDPVDCSLPGCSVHGILQAIILEWLAVSFSRVSSQLRDGTQVSCIAGIFFTV